MKLLVRLYRALNRVRTPNAAEFDRLYRLDPDPYNTEDSRYERHKREVVVRVLSARRYGSALDLGCGTGTLTRQLASFCDRVLGVDFAPAAVETARRTTDDARVSYAVADIREMREAGAYDLIVCSEVLYYLQPPELEDVIGRLARALVPGGVLALVGRADDDYLGPALKKRFTVAERVEDSSRERPFALTLWTPAADASEP